MDRRNVEVYLLYDYAPKGHGTLEQQLLSKPKKSVTLTAISYVLLWGVMLFDSWDSLISLSIRENINTSLVVFVSLSLPMCPILALLWARLRIVKSIRWPSTIGSVIAKAKYSIMFAWSIWLVWFGHNTVFVGSLGIIHLLLILSIGGLLGAPTMLYRVYLLRKYCPYLANYRGEEIN